MLIYGHLALVYYTYTHMYPHSLSPITESSLGCCADIDECLFGLDNCTQNCKNTNGGFECSCKSGFMVDIDGSSCFGEGIHVRICFVFVRNHFICTSIHQHSTYLLRFDG